MQRMFPLNEQNLWCLNIPLNILSIYMFDLNILKKLVAFPEFSSIILKQIPFQTTEYSGKGMGY